MQPAGPLFCGPFHRPARGAIVLKPGTLGGRTKRAFRRPRGAQASCDTGWMKYAAIAASSLLSLVSTPLLARGVSPYLPLNLDPQIERQIERALILADKPVLTRPFAAAAVLD